MPVAPVLQRFVNEELALAPAMVERILAGTLQLLRDHRDGGQRPAERASQSELAEALQHHGPAYQRAFVETLQLQVAQRLEEQQGGSPSGTPSAAGGLALMDESSVETDIEISRAIQVIDTTADWELRELQTFTSTLVGQTHVSAESHPLPPQAYATALWMAGCAVTAVAGHRSTLLRVSSGVAAGLLRKAWAAASSRLEARGVEPGLYRTVVIPTGSVPGRGPAMPDVTTPNALASLLASMPGGSPMMQVGVGQASVSMGSTPAPRLATRRSSAEFEQALARLEDLLRHLPATLARAEAETIEQRLSAHHAALIASAEAPGDRQAIELVSRVFDSMLSDPLLPPPFAPVVMRTRASALRVALRDPEMLKSTRHAVWQLLDRIGEAAHGAPHAGDPHTADLLALCRNVADELGTAAAPDATLYRRALTQVDTLLAQQMQSRLEAAAATVQTLQEAERRELLERHLSQRLVDQMVPVRTSAGVRRFVTGAWAKVLAEAFLRHGEQSDVTRGYIKLVDELLWSVQLPDHPKSRQRLIGLLPSMLQRLRTGMQSIKLSAAEQDAVLDELMAIHTEALRPNTRADAGPATPEQIVQRMRDEVLPAATGQGAFSDSVIDLSSMETIPAEMLPEPQPVPEDPAKRVELLRKGDRLRLFVQGRWNSVQLLWHSDQRLFYLFAGEAAARTHSITRRALERLAAAQLLQPLETRTLVQRALDAVMREVGRPAA